MTIPDNSGVALLTRGSVPEHTYFGTRRGSRYVFRVNQIKTAVHLDFFEWSGPFNIDLDLTAIADGVFFTDEMAVHCYGSANPRTGGGVDAPRPHSGEDTLQAQLVGVDACKPTFREATFLMTRSVVSGSACVAVVSAYKTHLVSTLNGVSEDPFERSVS